MRSRITTTQEEALSEKEKWWRFEKGNLTHFECYSQVLGLVFQATFNF